ncbi:MAG: helix-turn-helix domain-containing protein, partial [Candidatus Ratteibacteria bacterium]
KIIKRYKEKGENGLKDLSRRPKNSPNKTPVYIESIIIAEREKTGYGRARIARNLREKGIEVKESTVRYVLKRYNVSGKYKRSRYRKRVRFYDFEQIYPLSHFEVDLKEIYDRTTLSQQIIVHAEKINIPNYQWTAIDVKTRIRFLSYSYTKSFTNGLIFLMSIIYFLRRFGIRETITLQTDNGEEFGGKSVAKLEYLNREIFSKLNAKLIHIPKGKKEYNAFVERSHQTDDNEFYIPQLDRCESKEEFI